MKDDIMRILFKTIASAFVFTTCGCTFGAVTVTASRDYVDRKTTLHPSSNEVEQVGYFLGSQTNKVLASKEYVDSRPSDLTPATNYTDQVAEEFEDGTRTVRDAETAGEAAFAASAESADYAIAADGLVGPEGTYNWEDFFRQSTNAAVAVADEKISTNNEAFVSAVLAAPLVGASQSDLAELSDYGTYGTVGAALLALIAGLAALKRRVTSAETSLVQKASLSDLPYALVELSNWEVSSGLSSGMTVVLIREFPNSSQVQVFLSNESTAVYDVPLGATELTSNDISSPPLGDYPAGIELSRLSALQLLDRAGNRVIVSGNTTLMLPAANPGRMRDFLVRLTVSTTSAVTWHDDAGLVPTWDAMGGPPSSFAASATPYLYRLTEVEAGVWHCEDMLALVGLEAALATINGGTAS